MTRNQILDIVFKDYDEVERSAILEVAKAIGDGATTEEAYQLGNALLIAGGRDPVPVP